MHPRYLPSWLWRLSQSDTHEGGVFKMRGLQTLPHHHHELNHQAPLCSVRSLFIPLDEGKTRLLRMPLGVINKGLCKHPRHFKAPRNYKSNIIKHKFKKHTAEQEKYYCRTLALKADPGLFLALWFINFTCDLHINVIFNAERCAASASLAQEAVARLASAYPTRTPEDCEELAWGMHQLFASALFEKYPKWIIQKEDFSTLFSLRPPCAGVDSCILFNCQWTFHSEPQRFKDNTRLLKGLDDKNKWDQNPIPLHICRYRFTGVFPSSLGLWG